DSTGAAASCAATGIGSGAPAMLTADAANRVMVHAAIPTRNPAEFGPRLTCAVATVPIATAAPAAIHDAMPAPKVPNATAPAARTAAITIFIITDTFVAPLSACFIN